MKILIKNQIILLIDTDSKNQVYELKCIFEKINIKTWFRQINWEDDNHERNSIDDELIKSLDEIEKSSLVIFFITNKFLSSKTFEKQLNCAKSSKKVILTVKMENIDEKLLEIASIDINELTVFEMPNIDKSMLVEITNKNILDENKIDDDSIDDDEIFPQRPKKKKLNNSPLQKIIIKNPDDNLKHLLMLVLRVFGRDHHLKCNHEGLYVEPLNYEKQEEITYKGPIKSFKLKNKSETIHKYSLRKIIEVESKNELIIIDNSDNFYVYNKDSFVLQRSIDMYSGKNKELGVIHSHNYFWIDHLNQLCGAYFKKFYLFDRDFQVTEIRTQDDRFSEWHSITYSKVNKKIYAAHLEEHTYSILKWDENLIPEAFQKTLIPRCGDVIINIYQDYIYLLDGKNNYVHILDLNLTYIGIIGQDILQSPSRLITDANNSNYIIIQSNNNYWNMNENFFSVYCVHNFQFVGSFKRPIHRGKCIFNKNLLTTFVDFGTQMHINKADNYNQFPNIVQKFDYNVEYRLFDNKPIINTNFQLNIEDKFICKANSAYPHLYKNPYILPCGNSACLDCIYENYNILTNSYKCNLETCKEKHRLVRNLERNEKFNKILEDNFADIFKNFKEYGDKLYEYDIEQRGKV